MITNNDITRWIREGGRDKLVEVAGHYLNAIKKLIQENESDMKKRLEDGYINLGQLLDEVIILS